MMWTSFMMAGLVGLVVFVGFGIYFDEQDQARERRFKCEKLALQVEKGTSFQCYGETWVGVDTRHSAE